MRIGGFNTLAHDAGITIINEDGHIEFASTNERYTQSKHDHFLTKSLVDKLQNVDLKVFYEDCWSPNFKDRVYSWDYFAKQAPHKECLPVEVFKMFNTPDNVRNILAEKYFDHHRSHAASSFYTRPWETWEDTVMLSIDGAGKDTWTSNNIYTYKKDTNEFVLHHSDAYSIGALYTLTGGALGFSNFEEGTTMGLSCFGEPKYYEQFARIFDEHKEIINQVEYFELMAVGNHKGISMAQDWLEPYIASFTDKSDPNWRAHVAASLQKITEEKILEWAKLARKYGSKLCYAGGVAQNILANSKIKDLFDDVWIVSDPTDGGGSLGAAAWAHCEEFGGTRISWTDAYLGHCIEREVNPKEVVDYILDHKVCGIANGQAEFGPRALGNRSLIGDVRFDIQDTVNAIKKREKFRPFGPLILEEEFDKWFEGPTNGYMQYVCKPKHDMQSVIHVDGTSRVQTVPADSRSIIRPILEEYFERTGVPMLLNTSLNIKGRPMVNDERDAERFENSYNVRVF